MKAKLSLVALALAGSLPLAALAAQPADKYPADSQPSAAQPAMPATPATPHPGEGTAATPATPATPAVPPGGIGAATPMFKQLDKNQDGLVSKDEAKSAADVRARFETVDTDHNGKISAAEWNTAQRDGKL